MDKDYCLQQIKSYDYERYVAILLAPHSTQTSLAALYAFRIELDRVQTLVKEPMMGLIRFEWWREAIQKLFAGDVLRHQVIEALHAAMHDNPSLNETDFQSLINAYQTDFETKEFSSIDQLWAHAEALYKPFLALQASVNEITLGLLAQCAGMKHILIALQTKAQFMGLNSSDPLLVQRVRELTEKLDQLLKDIPLKEMKKTSLMSEYLIIRRFADRLKKAHYSVDLLGRQPDWLVSWYLFRKQLI